MVDAAERPPRTALCLCGGGITGAMYEIGALVALDDFFAPGSGQPAHNMNDGRAREPGFRVTDFDLFIGTSAGAFLAAMLASGVAPRRLFHGIVEEKNSFMPVRRTDIFRFDLGQGLGIARDLGGIFLSAMARGLRGTLRLNELLGDLQDALPAGIFSLHHYEKFLDELLRKHGLPTRFADVAKELYITANDLDSGHRAIFGQGALADVPISKAICASSAIPLFFEPVRWRGRDYIDGAVGKVEHADIALARGADLIVVVNPLVPFRNDPDREDLPTPLVGARHLRDKGMLSVYSQAEKMSTRAKLQQGLRRYRASHPHAKVLLLEPREEEGDMFLLNPMNFSSRRRIIRYGYESAARQLLADRQLYEAAWGAHQVRVDGSRLHAPWELIG